MTADTTTGTRHSAVLDTPEVHEPGPADVPRLLQSRTGGSLMAGKGDKAKAWLESQLSDGQEQVPSAS